MDEWMDGRTDGRVEGWMYEHVNGNQEYTLVVPCEMNETLLKTRSNSTKMFIQHHSTRWDRLAPSRDRESFEGRSNNMSKDNMLHHTMLHLFDH